MPILKHKNFKLGHYRTLTSPNCHVDLEGAANYDQA